MKDTLCFTTYVFGAYQRYIPYYIYSIGKIYPEIHTKIFVDRGIDDNVEHALSIIKKKGYKNFEILIANFDEENSFRDYKIKGGGRKTLYRWLFDFENFKEYDYLYYGDVDIIILPENISILNLHKQKIKEFNVPFSNKVRTDNYGNLTKRLTGLHFVEVKPYFEKVNPIIEKILHDKFYEKKIMKNVIRDEELLYNICKEAFTFEDKLLSQFHRPIHGLHLGAVRGLKKVTNEHLNQNQLSVNLQQLKQNLIEFYSDSIFRRIMRLVFIEELYFLNKFLNIKNPTFWDLKYLMNSKWLNSRKWINKIKVFLR